MFQFFGQEACGILALASLLSLLGPCFWSMFRFSGPQACRILAPPGGIKPAPTTLEGEVLSTGPPGTSQKGFQWYDFQVREPFSYLRPRISHNLYRQNKILNFLRKESFIVFEREGLVCPALALSGSKDFEIYKYSSISALNPQYCNLYKPVSFFGFLPLAMKNLLFLMQRTILVITSKRSVRTRRVVGTREGRDKGKNLVAKAICRPTYLGLISINL